MTYRCGIGPGIPGLDPCEPHVICDDCDAIVVARHVHGLAPMWLMDNKAPRGWLLIRHENASGDLYRRDYCPACRDKHKGEKP